MKRSMKKAARVTALCLAAVIATSAICGSAATVKKAKQTTVTVFAAASLTESFTELAKDLLKSDNVKVNFDFAGSQALVQAVEQGTKADVLAFASESYMKQMKTENYVKGYSIFAKNTLVACKLKTNKKTLAKLSDLGQTGVAIIAGDTSVPCGSYFDTVIKKSSLSDAQKSAINGNIKSKEMSVKDVLAKIMAGVGDFGIVYTTDITKSVQDSVTEIALPEFTAAKPLYPIALVSNCQNLDGAKKFISLVNSKTGKAVLKKYKFIIEK
jgi:molybdate transport system substrate-binding protein